METAFIAAVGALLGVLLKDFIFKYLEERRASKRSRQEIYQKYARPLLNATETFMWRLNETLRIPGRGRYLLLDGFPTPTNRHASFGLYKKVSTIYRLAALLGWMQALRRELSQLEPHKGTTQAELEAAIRGFQKALADGPMVEIERVRRLISLWRLPPPGSDDEIAAVAIELENELGSLIESAGCRDFQDLAVDAKTDAVRKASQLLCARAGRKELSAEVLRSTQAQAFDAIAIREAWLYRDWQSAIGDLMLKDVESGAGSRRFEVLGFGEFERLCTDRENSHREWISRLSAIFDQIDLTVEDPADYRPKQLQDVLVSTASVYLALVRSEDEELMKAKEASMKMAKGLVEGHLSAGEVWG